MTIKTARWKPKLDPEATSPTPIPGWTVAGGKPKAKKRAPKRTVAATPTVKAKRAPTKNPYGIE